MQGISASVDQRSQVNVLAARVMQDGWFKSTVTAMGHDQDSVAAAESIASLLGDPVTGRAGQKIEPLVPTVQSGANAKSLSVMHGLGSFPMHTDGAHRLQPHTFPVRRSSSPRRVPR